MSFTSATRGPLAPEPALGPADDRALDDILQRLVVDLTGLPGSLVRPRWQPTPPARPPAETDWCAIGVQSLTPDANAWMGHDPAAEGNDVLRRHELIEVLASFYGPNCRGYAGLLRDGLQIAQNRDAIRAQGIGCVEAGATRPVPDLVNQQWLPRCDILLTFRREIVRTYPVKNLLSASGSIASEGPATSWNVEP